MPLRFLFRVDAGGSVGLGHYFRSLALAEELKNQGHDVLFTSNPSSFWKQTVKDGFPFEHFSIADLDELSLVQQKEVDVFYADGIIDFDPALISGIKETAKVVFYQNIGPSRSLADVFILPSLHQSKDFFEVFSNSTEVYQGLDYFLFNKKVQELSIKKVSKRASKVALIAGGSDPENTMMKVFRLLDFARFRSIEFSFYYGSNYMHKESLPGQCPENIVFRQFDHKDILENDLLISAFGVSTYEFMALGMPVIAYGHQEANAFAATFLADSYGALRSLGFIENVGAQILNDQLNDLANDKYAMEALSLKSQALLNFSGLKKIVDILKGTIHERQ